jgi:hypothetical protein
MLKLNQLSGFGGEKSFRFVEEDVGFTSGVTDTGSLWNGSENLAYVGIITSGNPSSRTYTGFFWDGVAGDQAQGTQDNGSSEHQGIAQGMINVGPLDGDLDYVKTFSVTGLDNDAKYFIRLVGGNGPVTVPYSGTSAGAAYPQTLALSLLKNDIVIVACNSRSSSTPSNFSASGMTKIYDNGSAYGFKIFSYQMTEDGAFNSTLTNTNKYQQWVHFHVVFRPTP